MNLLDVLAIVLALGCLIHVAVALLFPEKMS